MTGGHEVEPLSHSPIAIRPEQPRPVAYSDADFTITAETAAQLLRSTPENTARTYDWAWGQFSRWCADENRIALPATPQTLADYVARLVGLDMAPATIDNAIGTIRSKHTDAGHDKEPNTRAALKLLNAYKREWADNGNRVRKATPLLLDGLRAMIETCDLESLQGIRDRAVLLIGFNMMGRRSEISGLDRIDIQDADEGINVYIRRSKTDQSAQGASVGIPYGQHEATCAIRAVRAWGAILDEHGLSVGAIFRPIDRHGRIGGEAEMAGRAAARLTGKSISDLVRRRARMAGLPDRYSGHSLRSGAATTAYAAGVPVSEIARHGRWSEKSPVVLGYIRAVDQWKNNPMKGIGL